MDDLLEPGVLNLEGSRVFEEGKRTARLEDILDDVDYAFNRDVLVGQRVVAEVTLSVTVEHTVDNAMRLGEEVDMHGRVDVPQKVLIDRHEQLHVAMVIDSGPNQAQLFIHVRQISQVLQLNHRNDNLSVSAQERDFMGLLLLLTNY